MLISFSSKAQLMPLYQLKNQKPCVSLKHAKNDSNKVIKLSLRRKKIKTIFGDDKFILSGENGYFL